MTDTTQNTKDEVVGLFPTPILIARDVIPRALLKAMIAQFEATSTGANVRTALLSHTPVESPRAHENYLAALDHILPQLRAYGKTLMGEELPWAVKEIWINQMVPGGAQKMHNHANSFVSGVIYLTEVDQSAATVFYRPSATTHFLMSNENKRCEIGPYNAPVFRMPATRPGDMVLFPSYLNHEVPPNNGATRMTAAFNALPERLDSWGYTLQFK